MYKVQTLHYRSTYRRGDLEDELVVIDTEAFKLRKNAKDYIESKLRGKRNVFRNYHKGNQRSTCTHFTGKTWIHENTGEKCDEYYQYILTKC